jgi:integrase
MRSQSHTVHFVKRPGNGRRSFSIIRRIITPSGAKEHTTLKHERLTALNAQLVAGVLTRSAADLAVDSLCEELNAEAKKRERGVWVASEDNLRLLREYFDKEYARRRSDKAAALARLKRAIEQLGPHSLLGDANTLQRVVDERFGYSSTVQRKYVAALNQMRKWFGVRERLALDREVPPEFRYVTEKEFDCILKRVDDPVAAALFEFLFSTGMRIGEAFAFPPNHISSQRVLVRRQMLRGGKIAQTKNRKERSTILMGRGVEAAKLWVKQDLSALRDVVYNRALKKAAMQAFPGDTSKHISVHDMRHSFAVHLVSECEVTVDWVAKLLGDSVTVAERYYLRFKASDENLDRILKKTL